MLLLRFRFENHASFRDECDLTLVQSRLKTSKPIDGTWHDYTNSVAAIYGPNASGKSGMIDALAFARAMIKRSATTWAQQPRIPRKPFRLDNESRKLPSTFVLDFVVTDDRYEYGFSVTKSAVVEEWLYDFPKGRKRILFERGADIDTLTVGRGLKGGDTVLKRSTGIRELVLSKGAALKNVQLLEIWDAITSGIDITSFGETDRQHRLSTVITEVAEGSFDMEDLRLMLKVADVGISGAEVAEEDTDPQMAKALRAMIEAAETFRSGDTSDATSVISLDDEAFNRTLKLASRKLIFEHVGAEEKSFPLSMEMQSTGTLTWLSLAAPAIKALRQGSVFAVDEIDASLHPHLSQLMVQMFKDDRINSKRAQLIFTTHDTYFLSPSSDLNLRPGEIWFVEKAKDGASELFSLEQFPIRTEQNYSRRYLQGRYGAIPSVAPAFLTSLVDEKATQVAISDVGAD